MKLYFLQVTTYNNTNRLGKAMAEFAVQYYQHRLTTEDGWLKMVDVLKSTYWSLKRRYPKVRKDFDIIDNLTQRKVDPNFSPCCMCNFDGDGYHCAFIINATVVKHFDYAILSHLRESDDAQLDKI